MNKILITLLSFGVLIAICVPVVLPFFHSGYFPTHDGEWAVVRLGDMFRELRDLQFPPRYSGALNFGYGYPLFNFTYPFPYYLGILFYVPLHNFVLSIKVIFGLSVFLSSIFMYLASFQLWKNRVAGIVSSIIYIYLPYRMVDLYVRGSIGESLSFAFFPLIFYLSIKLFDSAYARFNVVLLSISIAMLVLTHNIMTVLFLPILLVFVFSRIVSEKRWDVLQSFLLCLFLGAGLSFFFWFPALYEKSNILLSKIPIANRSIYFVKPLQLLIPAWGYSPPTEQGGFSYQLGISQIIIVLISLILISYSFLKSKFTQTPAKSYVMILLAIYSVCLLMMFSAFSFIWQLPLLKEINYPWTLLSQLGFITALLSGFLIMQQKIIKYFVFVLCILSFILVFPYAHPKEFVDRGDEFYITNEATTTSSSELMPLWTKEFPKEHYKNKVDVVKGSAEISELTFNSKKLSFSYKTDNPATFRINTIYYPGWKGYINGEQIKLAHDNPKGVIDIQANQYRNNIMLAFDETFPRIIADGVSVLSLLVISFILMRPLLLFKS